MNRTCFLTLWECISNKWFNGPSVHKLPHIATPGLGTPMFSIFGHYFVSVGPTHSNHLFGNENLLEQIVRKRQRFPFTNLFTGTRNIFFYHLILGCTNVDEVRMLVAVNHSMLEKGATRGFLRGRDLANHLCGTPSSALPHKDFSLKLFMT